MFTETTGAYKCPLCGKISRHRIVMGSDESDVYDLDTRPPETRRSTMFSWVQECPYCSYVASKLTDRPPVDAAFLKTPEYVGCGGIAFLSDLAKQFYRLYLIKTRVGDARNAYWSALEAAWASDDFLDDQSSVACRKLAIEPLEKWIEQQPDNEHLKIMKIDVLRRAGMFDEAIRYAEQLTFSDAFLQKIADYEVELAKKQDAACHKTDEVQ